MDLSRIIDFSDPLYSFNEVMNRADLSKYLAKERRERRGRRGYNPETLLKIVLFAFTENGYSSVRDIEKLCKTDIRYMWLLDNSPAPSFMTIENFIKNKLTVNIGDIFREINRYIFSVMNVDLNHAYIDGTKIEANANKYSWVWKRGCIKNRGKLFGKITALLEDMNKSLIPHGVRFDIREEYAIEYLEQIQSAFLSLTGYNPEKAVRGKGHHKTLEQRLYDDLVKYTEKLKKYAEHIAICGDDRNSYSKTDHDATFMRIKKDYMRNDRLLPAYNVQFITCDEFIAVCEVMRHAADTDCFVPLMKKFNKLYGMYPEYPVADAGYGSLNNYIFCAEMGMGKYMKFPMFDKTVRDKAYRDDPFRAVNFPINENGRLVCPGGREFHYLKSRPIKNNHYGRTEELWECESCEGCPLKPKCTKSSKNRIVQLNRELSAYHREVLENLNCVHGKLLRRNRSIQAEGAFGEIKWNCRYTRARRRGLGGLELEITLMACGFNLYKYHLKRQAAVKAA